MGKELIMLRNTLTGTAARASQERARLYLEKSCELGHSASFYYLGMIHELGLGGPASPAKALECYTKAKEVGDPLGYFKLAILAQEKGEVEEYIKLISQAAEMGLIEAQHNLGCFYLSKEQEIKAFAWFLNAAKFDFYPSMVNIGTLFLSGKGRILANPMAAFIWLKRAEALESSEQLQGLIKLAQDNINKISKKNGN